MKRKIYFIFLSVVPILFFLMLIIVNFELKLSIGVNLKNYILPQRFSSSEWKKIYKNFQEVSKFDSVAGYKELAKRNQYVYSIIGNPQFSKKNKSEILELLGPSENSFFEKEWFYWVNFTVSDNRFLVVKFDESDLVLDIYLYED